MLKVEKIHDSTVRKKSPLLYETSVLLVEETEVPREIHQPATSH
jgi:hypothetical protein